MSKRNRLVEEHYRKNYSRLVKVMTRRVPNQSSAIAEEVVQDAYWAAMYYFRSYNPNKSGFATWFEKILRNACNKARSSEGPVTYSIIDDETPTLSVNKNERELLHLIREDINIETGYERDVLIMFYYNGFKTIEIAEFLNKSHTAIRQVIFRWRNKMHETSG